MRTGRNIRGGFSLVEVALALLVVSVGLVAAVGMLPGSLDNSKRATDDTQQALFADYVLNTVRALAASTSAVPRWTDVNNDYLQIQIAAPDMWDQGKTMVLAPGKGPQTLVFKSKFLPEMEESTIIYDLNIVVDPATNSMKRVDLKLYSGSVQNTNSMRIFCAYLHRGDLP